MGNPSLGASTKLGGRLPADALLTLTVVLNRSDERGFESFLHEAQSPTSQLYRQYLSPRKQAERFGPSAISYAAVSAWLREQGLRLVEGSENRLTLTVSGTRLQAEKAFGVHIENYRAGDRTYYANDRDPILPASIAPFVQAVTGLSNLARPVMSHEEYYASPCEIFAEHAALEAYRQCVLFEEATEDDAADYGYCQQLYEAAFEHAEEDCLQFADAEGAGNGPSGGGSSGSSAARHFHEQAGALPRWLDVDGSGQTIGLVEFDTFRLTDMRDYLALAGYPSDAINRLSQVHVNGGANLGAEEPEVLTDIVAVMTNAPGANVVVYDAPFAGIGTSFQAIFNHMINDGVSVISNSWVYCEDQTTRADVQSIDAILASAAAAGITVLNATGDFGSTCVNGSGNTVSVPADAPHATAVGGTSLTVGPVRTYGSERFWNGSGNVPPTGQSGFGVSRFFSRPDYQNGYNTAAMRSVPDVSINGDPAKGIEICQADAGGCPTGASYGGTSLATPVWAAFVALLNQAQGQNLGQLNPLLYPLGNTTAFHSAASMNSDFPHVGLGSPNLNLIHRALAGKIAGPVSPAVSQNTADKVAVIADGVSEGSVVVRLRDADGHTVSGKSVTLTANAGAHATIVPATGISNVANGAVIFSVRDSTVEAVTFTATDTTDGIPLPEQSVVAFVRPPAAAGGISATPTTVQANGADTATITVTVQDANGHPSAGKVVNLSQGNGGSIITTSSAKTDSAGRVQFSVTHNVAESVTYTAFDASDRQLPIPGSATVTFVNPAGFCAGTNSFKFGTAAPGYAVTTFASSFALDCFGGLGPIGLAFSPTNNLLVVDSFNSVLYSFSELGGSAGRATRLGTVTPSSGVVAGLAFGPDGRLYAAQGNKVVELNPSTAAVVRDVITLPGSDGKALAVDPLSGDLFVSQGFDGIKRLSNYTSGPTTIAPYASGEVDGIVFAPDGTLYAASDFGNAIARIAGTNAPTPGAVTIIAFLNKPDGLAVELNPSNSAKPFLYVNRNDGIITRIDTSALPATPTNPCGSACTDVYGGGSRGDFATVGNDGCLYATQSDRVIRLTKADGTCGLAPVGAAPQLVLTPMTVQPSPAQGTLVTFTASLKNVANPADVPVTLLVAGVNAHAHLGRTDASGNVTISYTGAFAGADEVFAAADVNGAELFSNSVSLTWVSGKHASFLTLNQSPGSGAPNKSLKLTANLVDVSTSPATPVAGAAVSFDFAGQSCGGVTDGSGYVSCSVTPTAGAGAYQLTANFAGNSQLLESSDTKSVELITPPPRQLQNISTRTRVLMGDNVLIAGFIITGAEPKKVLLRGLGPSLTSQNVPGVLPDPVLALHKPSGVVTNDDWKDTQQAEIEATGIPPMDDRESAIVATLAPGEYTAILSGKNDVTGVGLVEVFELVENGLAKLGNISTRGFVDTGENVMIGGFIAGPASGGLAKVLIRALGPSLPLGGKLQDPTMQLFDVNGQLLAENDDWRDTQEADIQATTIPPNDNRESALVVTLAPGGYTAIVRGKGGTTGIGLIEVFDLR